jgi:hypothetical protein
VIPFLGRFTPSPKFRERPRSNPAPFSCNGPSVSEACDKENVKSDASNQTGVQRDRPSASLLPIACMFWLIAALMLWLSMSAGFDSILVYKYATGPQPDDLKPATFRITAVSRRTPNFKVRFANGETAWMSFPDLLGGDPKGGYTMPQITEAAREQFTGCMATAQIRTVLSAFGRINQVWDLDCPQAHLHFGPEVTASEIRRQPWVNLLFQLVFAGFFLAGAVVMGGIARQLGRK